MISNQKLKETHVYNNNPIGDLIVYFYLALSFFVGAGLLIIFIFIDDVLTRNVFIGFFCIFALVLAGMQISIQYSVVKKLWNPIKRLVKDLKSEWMHFEKTHGSRLAQLSQNNTTIAELTQSLNREHPDEVFELQQIFSHQLKLLEDFSKQAQSESALTAMGQVCSQVAHDMRSPISVLKTFLKYLPEDIIKDEDLITLKGHAKTCCERLNQMADGLLDYKREMIIERQNIDLSQMIRNICEGMKPVFKTKNILVNYTGPQALDYYGDETKLTRVIHNIVTNGAQAMENTTDGELDIKLIVEKDEIIVDVSDQGSGISKEHMDKLFLPTFTTKGKNGNGLGLAYCQRVVVGHGGQIQAFNNQNNKGATLRLVLPHAACH